MKNSTARLCLVFFIFLFNTAFSQTLQEHYTVNGACETCKNRIETAAKKAGASQAIWDISTHQLTVDYDKSQTSAEAILKKIAEAGHDNERYKADDSVYEKLPACCHYDRKAMSTTTEEHAAFAVNGNCDQCKARIETAAKIAGVDIAEWNPETHILNTSWNNSRTSANTILQKIAEAGHDNERYKAGDDVYEKLPECCKYDRSQSPRTTASESANPYEVKTETDMDGMKTNSGEMTSDIQGVTVTKFNNPTAISGKEAGLVYNISKKELLKAACCNLSESFETNATVDVAYSNAVTGTKQLKMLGLDQKYTALTKELLPEIRGLATAYGLNFIPGRWIGGIQLTKGGSTVTNGYESITGQINTELLKYNDKPETALNVFLDNNARAELNITHLSPLNDKWNQSILIHGNGTFAKMDYNNDGFLDQPTGSQMNLAYLLNYNDLEKSGWGSHFGISFLKDQRTAGQMDFRKNLDQSEETAYGVGIDISRFQIWNKTGYIFKGKPYRSLGWMNQFTHHEQNSFFGLRDYNGAENTYYSNLIYEDIIGNTNNKYKAGASFLYDHYSEEYLITDHYRRTETVPGLFAEYTLTGNKYTLVTGARVDFHNLAGTQFTPRLNFKYDITPKTVLRLSAGRGFRTANIFAESQQYFASGRTIEILDNGGKIYGLKPEIAWNYGASLQQEFKLFGRKSSIVADFFRTNFQNQVVTDLDQSAQKIIFYNLDGKSFANSFQTQWDFIPIRNLDVRIAYKYYDVETDYLSGRKELPFMAKHRGFANISYSTSKNEKGGFWSFDTTLNIVGKQRIPDTSSNPESFRLPEYSSTYTTLNAQIARNLNTKTRVYIGGDNLTSTRQKNPVMDAQHPFGNYFDGGMVYAPVMPANIYAGVDFSF